MERSGKRLLSASCCCILILHSPDGGVSGDLLRRGLQRSARSRQHAATWRAVLLLQNLILVKAIVIPSSSNYQHSRKFTGYGSIICFIGYSWPQQKALGGSTIESKVQSAKNFRVQISRRKVADLNRGLWMGNCCFLPVSEMIIAYYFMPHGFTPNTQIRRAHAWVVSTYQPSPIFNKCICLGQTVCGLCGAGDLLSLTGHHGIALSGHIQRESKAAGAGGDLMHEQDDSDVLASCSLMSVMTSSSPRSSEGCRHFSAGFGFVFYCWDSVLLGCVRDGWPWLVVASANGQRYKRKPEMTEGALAGIVLQETASNTYCESCDHTNATLGCGWSTEMEKM